MDNASTKFISAFQEADMNTNMETKWISKLKTKSILNGYRCRTNNSQIWI
jgi:hypothetical protein